MPILTFFISSDSLCDQGGRKMVVDERDFHSDKLTAPPPVDSGPSTSMATSALSALMVPIIPYI